jgi:hypothetical protein
MITVKDEAIIELRKAFAERDEFKRLARYARVIILMHDAVFVAGEAAVEPAIAYETLYEIVMSGLAVGGSCIPLEERDRIARQFSLQVTAGMGNMH